MMTKMILRWLLIPFAAGIASCKQSASHDITERKLKVEIHQQSGFPRSLRISISNNSAEPICIADDQIGDGYQNLEFRQNGIRIFNSIEANRQLKDFRGLNVANPVHVVTFGTTDFWYNLDDFSLRNGKFDVLARIRAVRCADLFSDEQPRWFVMVAVGHFTLASRDEVAEFEVTPALDSQ